jgi:hypothetical protein
VVDLSEFKYPASFKGIYPGVLVLIIVQFLGGVVHTIIGFGLIYAVSGELVYNVYTLLYGIFTMIFAYGLWTGKKSGWIYTIIVSLFVIVVDISTVLNIQLIPGVPKSAALGEISISIIFLAYLLQPKIVRVFKEAN